jgi:hypothetical protein
VTDQPIDFSTLAVPPQTGARDIDGVRGGTPSPVFDLMKDVLHGGDLDSELGTRGPPRRMIAEKWATATLIFGTDRGPGK